MSFDKNLHRADLQLAMGGKGAIQMSCAEETYKGPDIL